MARAARAPAAPSWLATTERHRPKNARFCSLSGWTFRIRHSAVLLQRPRARSDPWVGEGGSGAGAGCSAFARERRYFRCFETSFVMSNMLTDDLPPKIGFSLASALMFRRFFESCRRFFLM